MTGSGLSIPIPLEKVEWRVDSDPFESRGGFRCRYVPYHDARDAMDLLDEQVPWRWQDSYRETLVDGKPAVVCTLSIKFGDEWLSREDVGVPSNMEPQKGAFSDAFKRAGVKWGVARNVYDLPTLWAPCDTYVSKGKTRAKPNDKTQPSLIAQLREAGFSLDGLRLKGGDASGDDQTSSPDAVKDQASGQGSGGNAPQQDGFPPDPAYVCPGCGEDVRTGSGAYSKQGSQRWHPEHVPAPSSPVAEARKALTG